MTKLPNAKHMHENKIKKESHFLFILFFYFCCFISLIKVSTEDLSVILSIMDLFRLFLRHRGINLNGMSKLTDYPLKKEYFLGPPEL